MKLFLDTETTGLKIFGGDKIFGISWALDNQPVQYLDVRAESLRRFLEDYDRADEAICHNTLFDAGMLFGAGIDITEKKLDCTKIRAQLINSGMYDYSLDALTGEKDHIIDDLAAMFGGQATKNVQMKNLHRAPTDFTAKYAKQDIVALRNLYWHQEDVGLPEVHGLERSVLPVVCQMHRRGVRVDVDAAQRAVPVLTTKIDEFQHELNKLCGRKINVNSSPQMNGLLVNMVRKDGIMVPEVKGNKIVLIDGTMADKTKTGVAQFNKDCLTRMKHPAAKLVLAIRRYKKTVDTFLVAQILGHEVNGRIYPWVNQCGTITGRFSYADPNLQAIPKRDAEMKAILRALFLPNDGHLMLRCDYSQADLRGFCHYISGIVPNHPILRGYLEDKSMDFHQFVANMMSVERTPAKVISLGGIFAMGTGKLAMELGLPYTENVGRNGKIWLQAGPEAQSLFDKYHTAVPGVKEMQQRASSVAIKRGYVKSIRDRHLQFPHKGLSYKASGYLFQSFTADMIKSAMVATDGVAPLHLTIHDELIFSIDKKEQAYEIADKMEHCLDDYTEVPLYVEPEVGESWANTKAL